MAPRGRLLGEGEGGGGGDDLARAPFFCIHRVRRPPPPDPQTALSLVSLTVGLARAALNETAAPPPPFSATSDSALYPDAILAPLLADAVALITANGMADRLPPTATAAPGRAAPAGGPRLGPPIPVDASGAVSNAEMYATTARFKYAVPAAGAAEAAAADRAAASPEVVVDAVPRVTVADVRALRGGRCSLGLNAGCLTSARGRLAVNGTAWTGAGTNAFYLA